MSADPKQTDETAEGAIDEELERLQSIPDARNDPHEVRRRMVDVRTETLIRERLHGERANVVADRDVFILCDASPEIWILVRPFAVDFLLAGGQSNAQNLFERAEKLRAVDEALVICMFHNAERGDYKITIGFVRVHHLARWVGAA